MKMKIVPLGIHNDVEGKEIDVIKLKSEGSKRHLVISCEGHEHRVRFNADRLEKLFNHTKKDIKQQEIFAQLDETASQCECIRLKIWHSKFGITIIEDIMP
jgi:hypothetical protein